MLPLAARDFGIDMIKRREALRLAALSIGVFGAGNQANACPHLSYAFKPTSAENDRIISALAALRRHWNDGTMGQFVEQYCHPEVEIVVSRSKVVDRRNAELVAIEAVRTAYPEMLTPVEPGTFVIWPGSASILQVAEFRESSSSTDDGMITLCRPNGSGTVLGVSLILDLVEDNRARKHLTRSRRAVRALQVVDTSELFGAFYP